MFTVGSVGVWVRSKTQVAVPQHTQQPFYRLLDMVELREVSWAIAALFTGMQLVRFSQNPLPINNDSAFFLHAGWSWVRGYPMYTSIVDLKPPLVFELVAVLSLILDTVWLHIITAILSSLCMWASCLMLGLLARKITGGNERAAAVAALAPLTFSWSIGRNSLGIQTMGFFLFCGLAAIFLAQRDKPWSGFFAGALAVASMFFWQPGVIFVIIVLGYGLAQRKLWRTTAGVILTTAVILAPVVLQGAFTEMIIQVLGIKLLVPDTEPGVHRIIRAVYHMRGAGALFMIMGAAGAFWYLRREGLRKAWWLVLLIAWFGVQTYMKMIGEGDILPLMSFCGVGLAYFVHATADSRWRHVRLVSQVTPLLVLALVVTCLVALTFPPPIGGTGWNAGGREVVPALPEKDGLPSLTYLYWNQLPPLCYEIGSQNLDQYQRLAGYPPYRKDVDCGDIIGDFRRAWFNRKGYPFPF